MLDSDENLCSIKFEYTDDNGVSFYEGEIVDCDEGTIADNEISNVSSSAVGVNHWLRWKSITDTNILTLNSELDKKVIKTSSRITIYRDGTPTIVMGGPDRDYQSVKGYDIEKSKNLGSVQLSLQCVNKDGLFSPERQFVSGVVPNEINYLGGVFSPLYYFMNKIKVEEAIEVNGVKTYFERFNGWISSVTPSKSAGMIEGMEVIAFDAIYTKLNRFKPDNLHYTPTKVLITDDPLTTDDETTFEGTHSNWSEYPTPIIKIDGEIQDVDQYVLNLAGGKIVFRSVVGVGNWGEGDGLDLTNPTSDRKTYESGKADWSLSFTPIVYYYYEIYESVQYNSQFPPNIQWTSKTEVLAVDEYAVNYTTGTITLVTALDADDSSAVIGNKKNQKIRCQFRTGKTVTADYKYDVVGTNEVEDIIRDVAERAGFTTAELVKSVSNERLSTEDNLLFYGHKNNWTTSPAPVVKKNDVVISSGFTIDSRAGVIQFTVALADSDDVTCSYSYYGLQKTDVTLTEGYINYKTVDDGFDAIQEILGKVAPNYLVRCNEEGILEGEYETQRLIQIKLLPNDGIAKGVWSWSNSFYKEDYMLKSNKSIQAAISDEDIYTAVISLGEDADPPNLSLESSIANNVSWGSISGSIDNLIDYNVNTNVSWLTSSAEPTKGSVVCTITIDKERKWEKIDILIGTYNNNTIQERLYVEVGDAAGEWWRPSQNKEVHSGASGAWVSWENNYDEEREIKYVRVKLEEAWHWAVTTSSTDTNWMGKSTTDVSTTDYWAFALAEIQIWGKIDLVGKTTLDNCLLVGDGVKTTCNIPNVPYRVKDFSETTHGWIEKSVTSVKLFKNSLDTMLTEGVDYTLNAATGLITFLAGHIPANKDVICGNWVLDDVDPGATTFLASFENKSLLERVGIREYKDEEDVGLTTHLETINRADEILPEVSRAAYPAEVEVVYRPDVKIGQTVLIEESDLGI